MVVSSCQVLTRFCCVASKPFLEVELRALSCNFSSDSQSICDKWSIVVFLKLSWGFSRVLDTAHGTQLRIPTRETHLSVTLVNITGKSSWCKCVWTLTLKWLDQGSHNMGAWHPALPTVSPPSTWWWPRDPNLSSLLGSLNGTQKPWGSRVQN